MNLSNRVLNLELFSKGIGINWNENWPTWNSQAWQSGSVCLLGEFEIGRGDSHGSKGNRRTIEPLKLRVLWECTFLMPFFAKNAPKSRGSKIVFLMSRDMIPEPSQNKLSIQSSNIIKLIPPSRDNNFRHPVGALKSCPRVFARTWGYSFFLAKMTLPAIHMSSTMIQRDHAARGLSRRCSKLAPRLDEVKELTRDQAVRHGWLSTDFGWRSYTSSTKCQVPHLIFWPCRRWQ